MRCDYSADAKLLGGSSTAFSALVCSVCAPFDPQREHRVKTRYSQSPERGARKRNVLCYQFTVVFPSWTSPVRLLTHVGTADLARSIPAEPPLPTNKTPAAGGRESRGWEMKPLPAESDRGVKPLFLNARNMKKPTISAAQASKRAIPPGIRARDL